MSRVVCLYGTVGPSGPIAPGEEISDAAFAAEMVRRGRAVVINGTAPDAVAVPAVDAKPAQKRTR